MLRRYDGETVMRAYTPTSSDDDLGYFDLVVKVRLISSYLIMLIDVPIITVSSGVLGQSAPGLFKVSRLLQAS